jgi:hypothetical protein
MAGTGTLYVGSSAMLNDLTVITHEVDSPKTAVKTTATAQTAVIVKQPKATSNRDAHHQIIKARNSKVRK